MGRPVGQILQIIGIVEILERVGTPVALCALKHFVAGPQSRLAGQAQWVLERLAAPRRLGNRAEFVRAQP